MINSVLIKEKIDTLLACVNSAHQARSNGWKQGCFDAADRVYEEIEELLRAPVAGEADDLIEALGKCRDAFPIPDKVGSKLDLLWQEAMSDPTAVPEYVKLCAALSAQPGAQKILIQGGNKNESLWN